MGLLRNISCGISIREIAWAILFSLPFWGLVCLFPHGGSSDVTVQLDAARNLSAGKGYVRTINPIQGYYKHVSQWPVGYSAIIAGLLKTGLTLEVATKVYKATVFCFGLFFWYALAKIYLSGPLVRIAFLSLLTLSAVHISSVSSTEFTVWAIFPVLSYLLLGLDETPCPGDRALILSASMVLCLFPIFKFTGLGVFFICLIWVLLCSRFNIRSIIRRFSLLFLLPTATAAMLFLYNFMNAGVIWGGFISRSTFGLDGIFDLKLTMVIGAFSATLYSFMPENFFGLLVHWIGLGCYESLILRLLTVGLIGLGIYLSIGLMSKRDYKKYIMWTFSAIAGMISFLSIYTLCIYGVGEGLYKPMVFSIYYSFFSPLLLIFFMICIQELLQRKTLAKRVVLCAIIFLSTATSFCYAAYRGNQYRAVGEQKQMILSDIDSITGPNEKSSKILYYRRAPKFIYFKMFERITDWDTEVREGMSGQILKKSIFSRPFREDIEFLNECNLDDVLESKIFLSRPFWFFIILGNGEVRSKEIMNFIVKYGFQENRNKVYSIYWKYVDKGSFNRRTEDLKTLALFVYDSVT